MELEDIQHCLGIGIHFLTGDTRCSQHGVPLRGQTLEARGGRRVDLYVHIVLEVERAANDNLAASCDGTCTFGHCVDVVNTRDKTRGVCKRKEARGIEKRREMGMY